MFQMQFDEMLTPPSELEPWSRKVLDEVSKNL